MSKKKKTKTTVANWSRIVTLILKLCNNRCERCDHSNTFKGLGRISIHAIDGDKTNIKSSNYLALCQRCLATVIDRYDPKKPLFFSYSNWYIKAIQRRRIAKLDLTSHS